MKSNGSMNRVFRVVWNAAKSVWQAVSEVASGHGKGGSGKAARLMRRRWNWSSLVAGTLLVLALPAQATPAADALPTGGVVTAGGATISTSGVRMDINQTTQRTAIDWQTFNIGSAAHVHFQQPTGGVALNRVLDTNASQIYGRLTSTGQVFLVNPNGVLFAPGAQVDVGGLVASTLNISNADFMAASYKFEGASSNAIINQGNITAAPGGTIALIAAKITNEGSLAAQGGNVLLGAGSKVTLDLGGPVKLRVEQSALDALIQSGGIIKADGGTVLLTAKAAGDLAATVINHTGLIEAQTLATGERGQILLLGDMENDRIVVGGKLDASAPNGGDGGFIETSAANVQILDDLKISTLSETGRTGDWLIDPVDLVVAAENGNVTGAAVSTALATTNVTLDTTGSGSCTNSICGSPQEGNGDIFVNDTITWNANTRLTLNAYRNIYINDVITASHATGAVTLKYGQGSTDGVIGGLTSSYGFGLSSSGFAGRINLQAKADQTETANFVTQLGSAGIVRGYTVITTLGTAGGVNNGSTLQGMKTGENYVLGANIDATATASWTNSYSTGYLNGQGFRPIGSVDNAAYTGWFDGLGHTVDKLYIYHPYYNSSGLTRPTGLFSTVNGGAVSNVGLTNMEIVNYSGVDVGGLVGRVNSGIISNSYATTATSKTIGGSSNIGGLVGNLTGPNSKIIDSWANTAVTGNTAGGLLGSMSSSASVTNSYAKGTVTGSTIGGLVGSANTSATISNSYASGAVGTANSSNTVGGLVGSLSGATVEDSYYSGTTIVGHLYLGGLFGTWDLASSISNSYYNASTTQIKGSAGVVTLGGLYSTQYDAWQLGNRVALTPTLNAGVYELATVADLQNALAFVYTDGIQYKLTADINLASIAGWNLARLKGTFDGSGWTLSNVNVSQNFNNDVGLFGKLDGATVSNLTLSGANVSGYGNTGALAGSSNNTSSISGVAVTGAAITGAAGGNIGGLVGYNTTTSTISGSSTAGTLTGTGASSGGLVGLNDSAATASISSSSSSVTLTVTANQVGGLVGKNSGANIDGSIATGNVTATSQADVGGLVGLNTTSAAITDSYATGAVSGNNNVGGLVGLHTGSSTITYSYADGAVTGSTDVGGLAGESNASTITGSHAKTGAVTGSLNGSNIGGLIGQAVSTMLSDSYSTKNVSGTSPTTLNQVGGLIGFATNTSISNSYATGTVSGGIDVGGLTGVLRSGSTITDGSYYAGTTITGTRNVGGLVGNDYLENGNLNTQNSVLHDTSTRMSNSFYNADTVAINGGKHITLGAMYNKQYSDWFATGGNNRAVLDPVALFGSADEDGYFSLTGSNIEFALGFAYHDGIKFKLTENIDLSNITQSDNAGAKLFQWHLPQFGDMASNGSSFDGGGFTLSNLNVTQTFNNDIGMFGRLVNAEIKNLNLNSSSAGTATVGGYANVGGLVGYNHKGTITDINAFTVNATGGSGFAASGVAGYAVGGLVGYSKANSTITNINSEADRLTGTISSNGRYVGGLVGYNEATSISNAHTNVTLAGAGTQDYGGLVGFNTSSPISNSSSNGITFNATGKSNVGGLVGNNNLNSLITASYSTLSITGTGTQVGGLVGANNSGSSITNSYATGAIAGNGNIGGLVGTNSGSTITGSHTGSWVGSVYAVGGDVTSSGSYVGGLVGQNSGGTITNSYAAATVQGGSYVGGLVGFNSNSNITGSYTGYSNGSGGYIAGNGVSGTSYVGGLVGYDSNTTLGTYKISGSFATGAVSNTGASTGGLLGYGSNTTIENSYATGDVAGVNQVGGLVGDMVSNGNITGAYAEGNVIGGRDVGGLIGGKYNPLLTVANSYYNVDSVLINGGKHMTLGGIYNKQYTDWKTNSRTALVAADFFGPADGQGFYSLTAANIEFAPAFIYSSIKFKLAEDIDLANLDHGDKAITGDDSKLAEWSLKEFRGTLDGNGKTLSNLTINQAFNGDLGLVGRLIGGGTTGNQSLITNLNLANPSVTGYYNIGSLVGYNRNSSVNVISSTNVTISGDSTGTHGTSGMGGLIGYSEDTATAPTVTGYTIQNSSVSGVLNGQGNNLGGLVGYNDSMAISGSSADVAVTAGTTTSNYVAGLVGYNFTANVSNSSAAGAVSATGKNYVGGLIGFNTGFSTTGSLISSSFAAGDVSGASYVGGLIGQNQTYSTVNGSYATGNVTATGNYVGGLVGGNQAFSNIGASSVSYATGAVTGAQYTGGLIGYNSQSTVTNSYTGVKTGSDITTAGGVVTGTSYVGGLIGGNLTSSSISGSSASGAVVATGDRVGGLIGDNASSTIANSTATGNVTATSRTYVGGLIGINSSGAISGATAASGSVVGGNYTGGLIGYNTNSTITGTEVNKIAASGNVTGGQYVGGLIGHNLTSSTINWAVASGDVTSNFTGSGYVGGLIGMNHSAISNASSTSKVTAANADYVGGLIGQNSFSSTAAATITSSFHATGDVLGRDFVGGLVGYNTSSNASFVSRIQTGSYASGNVTGRNDVGGLVGMSFQYSDINGSYFNGGTVMGVRNVGGLVGRSDITNATVAATITNSYYNLSNTLIGSTAEGAAAPANHITLGGLGNTQYTAWISAGRVMPAITTYFTVENGGVYDVTANNIEYMLGYTGNNFRLAENIDLASLGLYQFHLPEFRGTLNGNGKSLSNLQIDQPFNDDKGFIGRQVNGSISNLVIAGDSWVKGWDNVGGLVGYAKSATITNTGVDVDVTGKGGATISTVSLSGPTGVIIAGVGGLVGKKQEGSIATSFSLGSVTGESSVGGLVGYNYHPSATPSISNSYATGDVTGTLVSGNYLGGLIGFNQNANLSNTYASGKVARAEGVTGGYASVGGLIGGVSGGTITASYFNSSTGGLGTTSANGTARTLTQLQTLSTFKPGTNDWGIRNTGTPAGETWRIYEGSATPILTYFLTQLSGTIGSTALTKTYDANNWAAGAIAWSGTPNESLILGDTRVYTNSKNVGTYENNTIGGVWSTQLGYDLTVSGTAPTVTINQADLQIFGGTAQNKEYDGNSTAVVTGSSIVVLGSDVVTLSAEAGATFSDKNAGDDKVVTTAFNISGGDAINYNLIQQTDLKANITPKTVTLSASKTYDGTTNLTGTQVTITTGVGSETLTFSGATVNDKDVATAEKFINGITLGDADDASGGLASNYTWDNAYGLKNSVEILAKTVSLNASKTYDGTKDLTGAQVTITTGVGSETLTFSGATVNDKDVATTEKFINGITLGDADDASGGLASNYTWGNTYGLNNSVEVLAKTVSLSASKTYDGSTDLTGFVTLGGLVGTETLTYSGATASSKHVATVDKYISAITLGDGTNGGLTSNYALPTLTAASAGINTVTINPVTLTATLSNTGVTKEYDGTLISNIVPTYTFTGWVTGDEDAELTHTGIAYNSKNVLDANKVTVSGLAIASITGSNSSEATDYVLDQSSKDVAATITAQTVTLSATKIYDGTDSLTGLVTIGGLVGEETLSYGGVTASSKDVATLDKYINAITLVDGTNGGLASNYALPSLSVAAPGVNTLSINRRPVTVTADSWKIIAGQPIPSLTYKAEAQSAGRGLVSGEMLQGALAVNGGSTPGSFPILQGTLADMQNDNYTIDFISGLLSVDAPYDPAIDGALSSVLPSFPSNSQPATDAPLAPVATGTTSSGVSGTSADSQSSGSGDVVVMGGLAFVEVPVVEESADAGEGTGGGAETVQVAGRDPLGFMRVLVVRGGISLPEQASDAADYGAGNESNNERRRPGEGRI